MVSSVHNQVLCNGVKGVLTNNTILLRSRHRLFSNGLLPCGVVIRG